MLAPVENRAALDGPLKFKWWPDWRDKTAAIVACGPSAKTAGVDRLRGKLPAVAIKEAAVQLCPWADVVYGCDAPWWRYRLGLPAFQGLKLRWAGNACNDYPDVHGVRIQQKAKVKPNDALEYVDQILTDEPGVIGSGRNSGFQALNLVVQFGVRRVLLIGFDLSGEHFYGRNNWPMANNPDDLMFQRCAIAFRCAASDLKRRGVEVVSTSPSGVLNCFPTMTIEQAIKAWNL